MREGRKGKGDAQSSSNFLQPVTTTQKEKHASPIEKERKRSNIDPVAPAMGHWGKRKPSFDRSNEMAIDRKVDPPLAVNTDA